jgi:hypothetical protein
MFAELPFCDEIYLKMSCAQHFVGNLLCAVSIALSDLTPVLKNESEIAFVTKL